MKKFYRGSIPNYKMDEGWTSPLDTTSKVVQEQIDMLRVVPNVVPISNTITLKSPPYVPKINYIEKVKLENRISRNSRQKNSHTQYLELSAETEKKVAKLYN
jgi:hypothetical protein